MVDWSECGDKILGGEIDLLGGLARNTGTSFQGKLTNPVGDIADDGRFCVHAVESPGGHEALDLLKLRVDRLDGVGIRLRCGELNRLAVPTLGMVIIVIVIVIVMIGIVVIMMGVVVRIVVIIIVGIAIVIVRLAGVVMIGVIVVAYIAVVGMIVVSMLRLGATLNQEQAKGQDEYPQNRLYCHKVSS